MRRNLSNREQNNGMGKKRVKGHHLLYLLLGFALTLLLALFLSTDGLLFSRTDPTWAAMQNSGMWRVGMDPSFPPFESLDASGKPVGYDVDLATHIAQEWGLQLEIVPIGFDSLLDALRTGQIDSVISALPFDPRATKDVTYSEPYFEAGIRLAVRGDDAAKFIDQDAFKELNRARSTADAEEASAEIRTLVATLLHGLRVGVEWGSMGDMIGRQLQRIEPTIELVPYETPNETVVALQMDRTIDGVLIDNITLRQAQGSQSTEHPVIIEVGPAIEGNPYVIALPYRATELQKEINTLLQMFQTTGRLSDLEKRWFSP